MEQLKIIMALFVVLLMLSLIIYVIIEEAIWRANWERENIEIEKKQRKLRKISRK